jgi:hypothetical protein
MLPLVGIPEVEVRVRAVAPAATVPEPEEIVVEFWVV